MRCCCSIGEPQAAVSSNSVARRVNWAMFAGRVRMSLQRVPYAYSAPTHSLVTNLPLI